MIKKIKVYLEPLKWIDGPPTSVGKWPNSHLHYHHWSIHIDDATYENAKATQKAYLKTLPWHLRALYPLARKVGWTVKPTEEEECLVLK